MRVGQLETEDRTAPKCEPAEIGKENLGSACIWILRPGCK